MKSIGYVLLSFAAMALLYVAMPPLSVAFSMVYHLVGGVATFYFVCGLPLVAWKYGKGEFDSKNLPACLAVFGVCLVYWMTTPRVEVEEHYRVVPMVLGYEVTGKQTFHCLDDAIAGARLLYKNRSSWARDDEGKFAECDVKISIYRAKPCFYGINRLLGTKYGITSYFTSIRLMDDHESPWSIYD